MRKYRIDDNGVIRDMTPEEVKEYERMQAELPPPEPSPEERLSKLEQENAELREALNALLERKVQ